MVTAKGALTLRNSACPKPCISQLDGTSIQDHFLSLNDGLKKSFGTS